ncbi:MAG: hypothetical protein R3E89_17935 [Thiolinea sp.]
MDQAFLSEDPRLEGHQPSELPLDRALLVNTAQGEPVIMCQTVTPATASGKIEL